MPTMIAMLTLAAGAGTHDRGAVLLQLLLIFGAAMAAEVFERLRQPAVVGEILAGVLIGPQVLGWTRLSEILTVLAELGVLFLLLVGRPGNAPFRAPARRNAGTQGGGR